ncbi:hypothetical protein DID88_005981 [Monilinia fructigena]|uniref:Uncharacterized protein n=1 Tax=Monilinia fructigena TaxID=38457 RepID=A0A395J1S0_9HELO|nr:hypothetical protein DID88_005981 [Monilinia fructigena]
MVCNRSSRSLVDNFRWGAPPESATPLSAYPQSTLTPSTRTHLWPDNSEPQSAIMPNKSRSRRRHGPAVSSAWPSNGGASAGKLRGRPPSNRSVTDGPFSTFPANPGFNWRHTSRYTIVADSEIPNFFPGGVRSDSSTSTSQTQTQNTRPNRLSLQVPQRKGGNVRLATPPPPVVLLNASHFVKIEDFDRTNIDALESHFIGEILVAAWYDVAGNSIQRCSIDEASKICKQVIRNLQAESSSTEAFLINLSALAGAASHDASSRYKTRISGSPPRTDYECHWKMRFGSLEGDFTIRATVVEENREMGEGIGEIGGRGGGRGRGRGTGREEEEESWKAKYLNLQQQIKERDVKVKMLKRSMVDALVISEEWIKGGEAFPNQG